MVTWNPLEHGVEPEPPPAPERRAGLWSRVLSLVAVCAAPGLLPWLGIDLGLEGDLAHAVGALPGGTNTSAELRRIVLSALIEWSSLCAALCVCGLAFAQARISQDALLVVLGAALGGATVFQGVHVFLDFRLLGDRFLADGHPILVGAVPQLFHAGLLAAGSVAVGYSTVRFHLRRPRLQRWIAFGSIVTPLGLASVWLAAPRVDLAPSDAWVLVSHATLPVLLYLSAAVVLLYRGRSGRLTHVGEIVGLSTIPAIASALYLGFGWSTGLDHAYTVARTLEVLAYLVPAVGLVWEYREAHEAQSRLATDLEERRFQLDQTLRQALHDSRHDSLTGLPNRLSLIEQLGHAVAHARRYSHPVAVMLVDLDRFKQVNDNLGHDVGDEVLRQVAWRLARASRESDVVGRFGGDVFGLVLYGATGEEDASVTATELRASIEAPVRVRGRELVLTSSLGIAFYPMDAEDPEALIRRAELALAAAKEVGGGRIQFFEPMMQQASQQALEIERELRIAIDRKEFVLHFQPQVDLKTLSIVGAEALLRWEHPERGLVPPLHFLPVAERTGLIVPIGAWVIRAVCEQRALWSAQGLPSFPVSLNVSAEQFQHQQVADQLWQALEDLGIDGREIHCEVTESCVIRNPAEARAQLDQLRELGARIALDDFGTGYSSLSTLKQFPIDVIKIDRSFVSRMGSDRKQLSIVSAIVALAESLGLDTIAEGIENEQELALLRDLGCAKAQGYLFSKPLPADDFAAWAMARTRSVR